MGAKNNPTMVLRPIGQIDHSKVLTEILDHPNNRTGCDMADFPSDSEESIRPPFGEPKYRPKIISLDTNTIQNRRGSDIDDLPPSAESNVYGATAGPQ